MPRTALPDVRAIVFDVGEVLVDESRAWTEQARRAGVTPFALMGSLGAIISTGRDHREVRGMVGAETPCATSALEAADLDPDALPCLRAARRRGYLIGIAAKSSCGPQAAVAERSAPRGQTWTGCRRVVEGRPERRSAGRIDDAVRAGSDA